MAKRIHYMRNTSGDIFSTHFPEYHKDCESVPRAEGEQIVREQTRAALLKMINPGSTIYCVLRSVSSSGMSRRISLFVAVPPHDDMPASIANIDGMTTTITGRTLSGKGGIVANGCGMDMGFDLVYSLGRALWPNGTPEPHGSRNGEPDTDGGYALKQAWL